MKKLLALLTLGVALACVASAPAQTLPPLYKQVYQFQNRLQVVDPVYTMGTTSATLTSFPVTFFWSDWFINQNPPGNAGAVAQTAWQSVDLVASGTKTVTVGSVTLTYLQVAQALQQIGTDNYSAPAPGPGALPGAMSLSRPAAATPAAVKPKD